MTYTSGYNAIHSDLMTDAMVLVDYMDAKITMDCSIGENGAE